MIVCENCFTDLEIIARIKHNVEDDAGKKGNCPICGSNNVFLYDTDHGKVLDDIFDTLLDLYVVEEKLPAKFPECEKKYLYEDILQNWNLFNPKLDKYNIECIIKNISKEYCKNNADIFLKRVGMPDKINVDILSTQSLVTAKVWDDFVDALKTKNRFHTNLINEDVLKRYCSFLEKKYERGQKFFRGRISRIHSGLKILEMGAPPFDLAKPGRANAEGIRHLYLANDEKTTIHEVRAGAYDIISVGTFELQKDIVVVDFQKLEKISPFSEGVDMLDYAINIEYLKRMNKEMSKTLRRDDSQLDYIPTQFIADYIKSFYDTEFEPSYRGIEYQSTMNKEGYNLVAFYPDDFDCISVKTISVMDIQYKYG